MAAPKNSIAYHLGNIDGHLVSLDEKMNLVLEAQPACRTHCDTSMRTMGDRVDHLAHKIYFIWGAWAVAVAVGIWAFRDALIGVIGLK